MSDETTLLPCPFCGGEIPAPTRRYMSVLICPTCNAYGPGNSDMTNDELIAAWNTRTDYHGYEQAAIEAWKSIKAWNTRATHGTLTAEQVCETVEKHWHDLPDEHDMPEATALPEYSYNWQAIADELNAELGSGTCEPELIVYNEASDDELFRCSYCHCKVYNIDMTEGDCGWGFTFCPQCGGEVYESDSRKIEAKLDETTNGIGGETNGIHADAPLVDGDAVSIMRDLRGCVDVPMLKDTLCRETDTDNLVDALETLADMIERDYVSRQDFAAQHRTLCGVREQRDEAREQVDAMRDVVRDFLDERDEWKTKFEAREFAYKQADAERKRYSEQIYELLAERDEWKANLADMNAELGSGTCRLHYGEDDDGYDGWYCDECGGWFQAVRRDGRLVEPKHCQECGKAVKR